MGALFLLPLLGEKLRPLRTSLFKKYRVVFLVFPRLKTNATGDRIQLRAHSASES